VQNTGALTHLRTKSIAIQIACAFLVPVQKAMILRETFREVAACRRTGIIINGRVLLSS
jgi:hypothetical protein